MAAHNPYAPSKASLNTVEPTPEGGGVWRDSDEIVVAHGHGNGFPHRCVKCNEPSEQPHKSRKVYWHHPAVYLLLLGYAILYVIVALIVRKTAEINPGLCAQHLEKRRLWIGIGWGGALFGWIVIVLLGNWLGLEGSAVAMLAILGFLLSAILGIVNSRVLYPKRIDARHARLKGADPRFLDSLPNLPPY